MPLEVDGTIECVEGTGGSGTSEITQNLYNIMHSQNNDRVQMIHLNGNSKDKLSIESQGLKLIEESLDKNSVDNVRNNQLETLDSNQPL